MGVKVMGRLDHKGNRNDKIFQFLLSSGNQQFSIFF